ncbi:MAG: hypothetical protein QXD86_05855, partial [Candidatus Bathyarchaeia archaeon]
MVEAGKWLYDKVVGAFRYIKEQLEQAIKDHINFRFDDLWNGIKGGFESFRDALNDKLNGF